MSWLSRLWGRLFGRPVPQNPVTVALAEINAARSRWGMPGLVEDLDLIRAAEVQATACARLGRLDHQAAGNVKQRLRSLGRYVGTTGECLAQVPGGTAAGVAELWMSDPPHRLILLGDYRFAGLVMAGDFWCLDVAN